MSLFTSSSKKYIFTGALFLTGLLISFLVANAILLNLLRNSQHEDFTTWTKVVDGEIDAEVLFIGSSRALVHYDCKSITKTTSLSCYNLGLNATGVTFQHALLDIYLRNNKPPKYVVFSLDPQSFDDIHINPKRVYRQYQYAPYLGDNDLYQNLQHLDKNFKFYKYIPLYTLTQHRKVLDVALGTLFKQDPYWFDGRDEYGFRFVDREWDGKFDNFKKENPEGRTFGISDETTAYLLDMINMVRDSAGIPVLAFAPIYYEFDDYFKNKNEIFSHIQSIVKKHDIVFWDYYLSNKFSYKKENFYNSQHLKGEAAIKYSEIIAKRLLDYSK